MKSGASLLPGLNALRFFAAFFVVVSHGHIALVKLGVSEVSPYAFFNRGGDAVEFFFTLSGFLITWLLISEISNTGTVSVQKFYLRRVFRIWPLYFLVVGAGFILLGIIYPRLYGHSFFSFTWWKGLLLFICFLPNYMAKNFAVGLLNPLWSIGVEEQFYLFWAPFIKRLRKFLFPAIIAFLLVSLIAYAVVYFRMVNIPENWSNFLLTQKFYAMAIGSLFGYILFFKMTDYENTFLARSWFQALLASFLLWYYLFSRSVDTGWPGRVFLCLLYGLLMLNVSSVSKKILHLDHPLLSYLGSISYGIYMYHMLVDYFLRSLSPRIIGLRLFSQWQFALIYQLCLIVLTVIVSAVSYRYYERFFLLIKNRYSTN